MRQVTSCSAKETVHNVRDVQRMVCHMGGHGVKADALRLDMRYGVVYRDGALRVHLLREPCALGG